MLISKTNSMTELLKISFLILLIYPITIIIRITLAGFAYDTAKMKIDKSNNNDHSGIIPKFDSMWGHFKIPLTVKDSNPKMTQYVTKYNRLTGLFWFSYIIGIPLLIYLIDRINKT